MAQGSPPQATTAKPPSKAETFVNTTRSLVRPFLAVSFTGAAIALTFKGLLPAAVIGTAATAISSFYFGERSVRKGIPPLNSRGFNNPDASQGETDRST